TWIPHWGRDRIYGMIQNRPDWCISRQRSWGVPIIALYCKDCGETIITEEIIEHVANVFETHGADIWFTHDTDTLIPKGTSCPNCGGKNFLKETDILDVWFDSGVSHSAVLETRDYLTWPADMYLEGSDQHRGWFHSSLLTAAGTRQKPPYKNVLTHGFVVDEEGRKMSKSVGNIVAPSEVIEKYGAEILRLWVSASDYRDDIRISNKILKQLSDAYRKIRNTSRFILGNLYDFNPAKDSVPYESMMEIDRFAINRLQELIKQIRTAYKAFEFHTVYHSLFNFCTLDLSAFYLDVLKDRLYTSQPHSLARRSAQTALYIILDTMVRLMAPILVFTAEEVWDHMPDNGNKPSSVHLVAFPEVNEALIDTELSDRWNRLLAVRGEVTKALEEARNQKMIGHSLDAKITLFTSRELFDDLKPYSEELRSIFIVSKVVLDTGEPVSGAYHSSQIDGLCVYVEPADGLKCERCWVHDVSVGKDETHNTVCQRCLESLKAMGI
nr:isoleucine--tRNA ligase [Desulfobacterales bacterium]